MPIGPRRSQQTVYSLRGGWTQVIRPSLSKIPETEFEVIYAATPEMLRKKAGVSGLMKKGGSRGVSHLQRWWSVLRGTHVGPRRVFCQNGSLSAAGVLRILTADVAGIFYHEKKETSSEQESRGYVRTDEDSQYIWSVNYFESAFVVTSTAENKWNFWSLF